MTRLLCTLAMSVLPTTALAARDDDTSAADPRGAKLLNRTLNGHRFLSSSLVDDPFISPHVNSTTSFSKQAIIYEWDEDDEDVQYLKDWGLLPQELLLSTVAQEFSAEIGILGRAAVGGFLVGDVQLAANKETVLHRSANGGATGGGTIRALAYRNRYVAVGGNAAFFYGSSRYASPVVGLFRWLETAEELYESGEAPELDEVANEMAKSMFSNSAGAGFNYGISVSGSPYKVVGLTLSLDQEYRESVDVNPVNAEYEVSKDVYLLYGFAVSASTNEVLPAVPMGIVFSAQGVQGRADVSGNANALRFGLYYTGREYLDLGLDFQAFLAGEPGGDGLSSVKVLDQGIRTRLRTYF